MSIRLKLFSLLFLFPILIPVPAAAQADFLAKVYSIKGTVEVQTGTSGAWAALSIGQGLNDGDQVRTGASSRAALRLKGGRYVRLGENSLLVIKDEAVQASESLKLSKGKLHLFSRGAQNFPRVETSTVSAAIRGTEFVILADASKTEVSVFEGQVELSNAAGSETLSRQESARVLKGSAPSKTLLVSEADSIQWALRYPVVLSEEDFSGKLSSTDSAALSALSEFRPEDAQSAKSPLIRAAALMALGSVDSALVALESSADKQAAAYRSQRALVHLVKGERGKAASLLTGDDSSLSLHLVRALLAQSRFDLGGAERELDAALALDPENALALARLAELKLGSADYEQALSLAKRASAAQPGSALAQTVLGFSSLVKGDLASAERSFEKALSLESELADAHLGLGLTRVRSGDLELGREDLEKAAHIEPNRAVLRSYLAKAYFEEERETLAGKEFTRAIELDPQDPTAYLYRAFNHLSRNRPVEALKDIETSAEKNENRALYRSKYLLDQDKATQGASLALVYGQLGFSEVSKREALKSLASDYSNFAAHRLLAGSLEGDFLADARFTQNTIADLLAPVSFNVFQAQRGFASDAGLNEYAVLFDRPMHRTGVAGVAGTQDDRLIGQVNQSGVIGDFGYFVGASGGLADGAKSGGIFEREERFDLSVQYQADERNRFFINTGYTGSQDRDLGDGTDLDDFEVSLGSHHVLGTGMKLINRIEYFQRDLDSFDRRRVRPGQQQLILDGVASGLAPSDFVFDENTGEDFWSLRYASQLIYDSEYFALIAGAEYLDSDGDSAENSLILDDELGNFSGLNQVYRSAGNYEPDAVTAYAYGKLTPVDWLAVDLGFSYREIDLPRFDVIAPFRDGEQSDSEFSPKVGLTAEPAENLRFHFAYFETLGLSSLSDIGSIEPTFISIFNQLQGDLPGAQADNLGFAFDYKIPSSVYFGAEYLNRDIKRARTELIDTVSLNLDTFADEFSLQGSSLTENEEEDLLSAYTYFVLTDSSTLTLDYERSEFRSKTDSENVDSDTVTVGLNYFDQSRFFGFSNLSWRNQERDGLDLFSDDSTDFWLLDAGLGYRLAKRHGTVRFVLRNILDQDFEYFNRGRENAIYPDFNAALEFSVNY